MNATAASRLRSIVYDTDFQTNVLDVAQTEGYSLPPFSTRVILNRLMKDMKNIGFYQLQDTLANFAIGDPAYSTFSMIDWKKTGNIYSPYGGLMYTIDGIEGNGINAYVDTNFNPATMGIKYTLHDASRSAVLSNAPDSNATSGTIDGVFDHGSRNTLYATNQTSQRINYISSLSQSVNLSGSGYKCISRTSGVVYLTRKDSVMSESQEANELYNSNQTILSRGSPGSLGSNYHGTSTIALYGMGGHVSDAVAQKLRTIYNEYLTRIHLEPIA